LLQKKFKKSEREINKFIIAKRKLKFNKSNLKFEQLAFHKLSTKNISEISVNHPSLHNPLNQQQNRIKNIKTENEKEKQLRLIVS
jgi:hypothetical protein